MYMVLLDVDEGQAPQIGGRVEEYDGLASFWPEFFILLKIDP